MLVSLQLTITTMHEDQLITRTESTDGSTMGWNVRFRHTGRAESKFFSDRMYGGRENALVVARMYRDARLNQLGPQNPMRHIGRMSSRNSTGLVGVCRTTCQTKGHDYDYWSAQWTLPDGRQCVRKFSINKYGEQEARKLAVQAREEGIKALSAARKLPGLVPRPKSGRKKKGA